MSMTHDQGTFTVLEVAADCGGPLPELMENYFCSAGCRDTTASLAVLRDSRKSWNHGNHGNRDFCQMP